jgi:exonuclease III
MASDLKIAHHNIRGFQNKLVDIRLFLEETQPDILTLNETLKINFTDLQTAKDEYLITQPTNNIGRGVAIIYKENIKITELPPITIKDET